MTNEEKRFAAALGDLSYCPESGVFTWKRIHTPQSRVKVGSLAGSVGNRGYVQIKHAGRRTQAHRLAFFAAHGFVPPQVDHINGIKTDNRAENLREATHAENQRNRRMSKNSATGIKGVSYDQRRGRYCAQVQHDGKQHRFSVNVSKLAATLESSPAFAHALAREIAAVIAADLRRDHHGEFARHG